MFPHPFLYRLTRILYRLFRKPPQKMYQQTRIFVSTKAPFPHLYRLFRSLYRLTRTLNAQFFAYTSESAGFSTSTECLHPVFRFSRSTWPVPINHSIAR